MYCRNCSKEMPENAVVCVECGVQTGTGTAFCYNCGKETTPEQVVCTNCGVQLVTAAAGTGDKSKLVAGLLGIFLGGFGVHRFYLGFTGIGIAQIAVTIVTCGFGAIWGLIEGILILTGSFDRDADGNLLTD